VDTSLFKPLVVQKRKRSIIFVGRLVSQKNIFSLLRALEGVDCSLTIIGDGPLRESILFEASREKVKLEYHEQIANEKLPDILNEHEIFVLPSFYEGRPKALLEAMACGLAVIGSPIDGIKELIKDGANGCVCRTDRRSIRETVLKLLQQPELIQRYGSEARKSIEQEFSLEQVLKKETDFYKSVLQ
jgi:glycosyltransferase involved in cell wall biosynthesis